MIKLLDDVAEFHRATDCPVLDDPQIPPADRVALRARLISEELAELRGAFAANDLVEIADALADSIYVLVGTALEFGIPLDRVWDEVHASNMTKTDPTTGKVTKREDGKILKPPTFRPPDIARVINPEPNIWKNYGKNTRSNTTT